MNTGRTWWKPGRIPWNKGVHGYKVGERTGKIIICEVCGTEKYFELNQLLKRPCRYCSVKCAGIAAFQEEPAVYSTIHARIKILWGKADICDFCGSTNTVNWANKDHTYRLIREEWLKLCRKCHVNYDKGPERLSECHPDRKHYAKSMCRPCYEKSLKESREVFI